MRVAMVCTEKLPVPPVRGGAIQTYIAGVLPFLAEQHQVTVIGISDPSLPDREEKDGARYIRVPGGRPDEYAARVAEMIATEPWDLVQVYNRPASVSLIAAAAPGAGLILSMHNDMFQYSRFDPQAARNCLSQVDAVVTISDYVAEEIDRLHPGYAHKIRTIRSGVDLQRFQPQWEVGPGVLRRVRRQFGFGQEPVILAVNRLSEKKGPHLILQAMEQVLQVHPSARLLLVGSRWYGSHDEDEYVRNLKVQAESLGDRVVFTGYVPYDQMPQVFLAGDLFVCASQWQEPLARVHYEAMAAGLPIITTDRGGNAEVIVERGNGLIVRPHDQAESFASAISFLLEDQGLRTAMGRRGRQLAESRYSWRRVASELLEVWEQVQLKGGSAQ